MISIIIEESQLPTPLDITIDILMTKRSDESIKEKFIVNWSGAINPPLQWRMESIIDE